MSIPAQNFLMHASHVCSTATGCLANASVTSFSPGTTTRAATRPRTGAVRTSMPRPLRSRARRSNPCICSTTRVRNDSAIALLLTSVERAKDLPRKPAYVLASTMGR